MKKGFYLWATALCLVWCMARGAQAEPIVHRTSQKKAPFEAAAFADAAPFAADAPVLSVDFIDILLGDAILLRCGGESMLVDGGISTRYKWLDGFFAAQQLHHFTYMLNTHIHDDHIGGLSWLLQRGYTAGIYYTPYPDDFSHSAQQQMLRLLQDKNISHQTVHSGQQIKLGGATLTFIVDEKPKVIRPENDASVMLLAQFGQRSILLTADVTERSQGYILEQYPHLQADVVKAPHHGYACFQQEFLTALNPGLVIVTNNKAGSPRAEKQLDARDIPRYYLGEGGIHLQTDGQTWFVYQTPTAVGKPLP